MRCAIAVSLLRMIPQELQGNLMAMMLSGNEINIQNIYRMEDEFMAVRGRLAGTTDLGTVIFIPYEQVDYFGFRNGTEVKEPELQAMFAGNYTPAPKAAESAEAPAAAALLSAPAATPGPAPMPMSTPAAPTPMPAAPALAATGSSGPVLPGKAALLERLRRSRQAEPNKPA